MVNWAWSFSYQQISWTKWHTFGLGRRQGSPTRHLRCHCAHQKPPWSFWKVLVYIPSKIHNAGGAVCSSCLVPVCTASACSEWSMLLKHLHISLDAWIGHQPSHLVWTEEKSNELLSVSNCSRGWRRCLSPNAWGEYESIPHHFPLSIMLCFWMWLLFCAVHLFMYCY